MDQGYDVVLSVSGFPEIDHALYVEAGLIHILIKGGFLLDRGKELAESRLHEIENKFKIIRSRDSK